MGDRFPLLNSLLHPRACLSQTGSARILLEYTQTVLLGQGAPTLVQAPDAKGQTFEEEHSRSF